MSTMIRALRPDDYEQWLALWLGYRQFYKSLPSDEVTAATWERLLSPDEPVHGLVVDEGQRLTGLVHYIFHRSTWFVGPVCYLQDLFTAEDKRGSGIGKSLIEAVYQVAEKENVGRVYWLTHETNHTAMALYDQVAEKSGFIQYRKNM